MTVEIVIGDALASLRAMADESVECCVTSPPYFGLRDYGVEGQIGLEATPQEYVARLVELFREVRRVLRDDGTLWLNIGDSYSRSPAKGGSGPGGKNETRWGYGAAQSAKVGSSAGAVGPSDRPGTRSGGLGEKQLLGIPWRLAFALQDDGWWLRQDIVWSKPNPMPESVKDRCTRSHEYLFVLAKSARYYYDADAVKEDAVNTRLPGRKIRDTRETHGVGGGNSGLNGVLARYHDGSAPKHRNRRSVWTIPTVPYKGAHFATFPQALVEPCVLAGSRIGGVVLDPFFGAGTTGLVARRHGRRCIGIELNPEYAALARKRLDEDKPKARRQPRAKVAKESQIALFD